MEKKKKILDTNILLDYPQIVTKSNEDWVIPLCVLREIDGLKLNSNGEVAKKARKAAVYISKNFSTIAFTTKDDGRKADDQLLELVPTLNGILITNDISLKVRAAAENIETQGFSWKSDYTGIKYFDSIPNITMEEYIQIIGNLETNGIYEEEGYKFSPNEYLIVPSYYEPYDYKNAIVFKYDGSKFHLVRGKEITNSWYSRIYPRNPEQICLVDALYSNSSIVYAGGIYGSGKTLLTHNYAISQLEKEKIKKIVYVPNNSYTQNTMEVGILPGNLEDKIYPSIGSLIDLVGIDQVDRWRQEEKLEIVPMAYMRGRNFEESIVIVNEAENLTEEHIKLLVARCGEGTRIFFDGDIHQADSAIFKDRNGLQLLLKLHESDRFARIFSAVSLNKIERSEVAAAADYLDSL